MELEQQLKQLILTRYKSIRAFSIEAEIPYSTIDNIFKRGIMGASINTVIRICEYLNLDVNRIASGTLSFIEVPSTSESFLFSSQEQKILAAYRKASPVLQKAVCDILHVEYEAAAEITPEKRKNA